MQDWAVAQVAAGHQQLLTWQKLPLRQWQPWGADCALGRPRHVSAHLNSPSILPNHAHSGHCAVGSSQQPSTSAACASVVLQKAVATRVDGIDIEFALQPALPYQRPVLLLKPAPWPLPWPCGPADIPNPQHLVNLQLGILYLLERRMLLAEDIDVSGHGRQPCRLLRMAPDAELTLAPAQLLIHSKHMQQPVT